MLNNSQKSYNHMQDIAFHEGDNEKNLNLSEITILGNEF